MTDAPATPLEELDPPLSTRAYNLIKREGIHTVEDLVATKIDLGGLRNMTVKALNEILMVREKHSLQLAGGELPLNNDMKIKVLMGFLGFIDGMHDKLDQVRDGFDSRNGIDHNVEQAQIALENASMRLQQVRVHLMERIEKEKK